MTEFPYGYFDSLTTSIKEGDVHLYENPKDRVAFVNEFCDFKPVGWLRTDFGWMPLGYKIVTQNLESLGLRNNPTPMKFPIGEWVFEEKNLEYNANDFGGIWTALRIGSVKTLKEHCRKTWNMKTRGFLTAMYNPVYSNQYRIKSEGVMLLKEI
jgi:hypothetical protein